MLPSCKKRTSKRSDHIKHTILLKILAFLSFLKKITPNIPIIKKNTGGPEYMNRI